MQCASAPQCQRECLPTRTRAWMVGPVRGCELMTGTMLCAAVQHATADRVLCAIAAVAATASTCRQPRSSASCYLSLARPGLGAVRRVRQRNVVWGRWKARRRIDGSKPHAERGESA